jgi:hypothetical protein
MLLAFAVLLAACGLGTRPDAVSDTEATARAHMQAGQFAQAAQEYLRLAELYPKSAISHQLGAAEAYLAAQQVADAQTVLRSTQPAHKQSVETGRKQLLLAEIALLQQHADEALELSAQMPGSIPMQLRLRRHSLRAKAFDQTGATTAAAAERVALLGAGPEPGLQAETIRALWSGLSALDADALQKLIGSGNAELAGWAELAQLAGQLRDRRDELESAINEWVAAHPGHAAVPGITGEILTASRLIGGARDHVALLLPLSGQFARMAAAIRDGFLMGMYLRGASHPRVTVLDSSADNVVDRYAEAVQSGAQFIIGPLEKEAVAKLAGISMQVPTLALNQIPVSSSGAAAPDNTDPMLFRFSLSPEDEAVDAARRAYADGHRQALIVQPGNEWGERLAAAFAAEWQGQGGVVLERVVYNQDGADYAGITRELFNLDSSQLRGAVLRQDLGVPIHSGARKRRDADMVFMPASPASARQIMPHFRYFGADTVPVYATAAVFAGAPNPRLDQDIDGVRFPDIPWVTSRDTDTSAFQQLLDNEFSASATSLRRLYAFGADAYELMAQMSLFTRKPGLTLAGETGAIYLDQGGQFHRRLSWAVFSGGIPAPLDSIRTP